MPNETAKLSGQPDNFCSDDLADLAEPELQLACETPVPLELEFEQQLTFDHMAKPLFAINVETDTSKSHQLHFRNAHNLLESLEAQKIDVPYQCRDGYCGACRCKKKSGDVMYVKEPMAWINEDEILPCVSIPTSDLTLKLEG